VQRTPLFTPDRWASDQSVFVVPTRESTWRVGLCSLPDEVTLGEAEAVAACLFQAAAEARTLQKIKAAKRD